MFISRPETSAGISLPEIWFSGKDILRGKLFQHYFCILHRISLWDIHREMHVRQSEPHFAELKTEFLKVLKSLDARVYCALLPKHLISILRHQCEGNPIISGVEVPRNFIATAIHVYI